MDVDDCQLDSLNHVDHHRHGTFFASTRINNLWELVSAATFEESFKAIAGSSLSVSQGQVSKNQGDNLVEVYMSESLEGDLGNYASEHTILGFIPGQYHSAARLVLSQSVFFLSIYAAGWSTLNSEMEATLADGFVRLSHYYRLVFLDLMIATQFEAPKPVPVTWRWKRFDRHLQREMEIGVHDPTVGKVKNFQYAEMDVVEYGVSANIGFIS